MPMFKIIGAVMIMTGCGIFGFWVSARHRREIRLLKQFIWSLDYMVCQLNCYLTPLPDLFRQTAQQQNGVLANLYSRIADELDMQIIPEVSCCIKSVLEQTNNLPESICEGFTLLGNTSGHFDLDGQLKLLATIRIDCQTKLDKISDGAEARMRCYQTLGLCMGAALAIIFV